MSYVTNLMLAANSLALFVKVFLYNIIFSSTVKLRY